MMRSTMFAAALLGVTGVTGACSAPAADEGTGGVEIVATTSLGLSAADVRRLQLTITGPGIDAPIEQDLSKSGARWVGLVSKIPAGNGRVFTAKAFDTNGVVVYEGSQEGVTIRNKETALLALNLQQKAAPPTFANHAPEIRGLVASSNGVAPEDALTLDASAFDIEDGAGVRYQWSSSNGGVFSAPTAARTTWTAPASDGPATLRLQVTDSKQTFTAMSFVVDVLASKGRGSASITARVNTWPTVENVTAAPGRIDGGESTVVDMAATDNDGDSLRYQWTATCAGTFASATAKSTSFTLDPSVHSGSCSLIAEVTDHEGGTARGGRNTGTISIQLGPGPSPSFAPDVYHAFQGTDVAGHSELVALEIAARDPEGTDVAITWSADVGSVAVTSNAQGRSSAVWTAPACFPPGTVATVAATVTDGSGVSATQAFTVRSDGTACPVACTAPRFVGAVPVTGGWYGGLGIAVRGGFAYVAGYNGGVQIFDVADPRNPTVAGSLALGGVWRLALHGAYAYIAQGSGGIRIADVSDPRHPTLLPRTDERVGDGAVLDVLVDGSTLYATTGIALETWDITVPSAPVLRATRVDPTLSYMHKAGNVLYLADYFRGFRVFDLAPPAGPQVMATVTPGYGVRAIATAANTVYGAAGREGLVVFDVTDLRAPREIARLAFPTRGEATGVEVHGTLALVTEHDRANLNGSIHAVDISNPAAPRLVATIPGPGFKPNDIVVSGATVYAAGTTELPGSVSGFQIADLGCLVPAGTTATLTCGGVPTNIGTDEANCGGCGASCTAAPNAESACLAGGCGIASCSPGFVNCDGAVANGCEVDTRSDPNHCGGCGTVCTAPSGATASCVSGQCTSTLDASNAVRHTAGGGPLFAWPDGWVNTNGKEVSLDGTSMRSGLATVAPSIWVGDAQTGPLALDGYQDHHAYREDGTTAWSLIQFGCCNVSRESLAIDPVNGWGYGIGLVKFDLRTGTLLGSSPESIYSHAHLGRSTIFGATNYPNNGAGQVVLWDRSTMRSQRPSGGWLFSEIERNVPLRHGAVTADDSFVINTPSGQLARITSAGEATFNQNVGITTPPVITASGAVVYAAGSSVKAHSLAAGAENVLWSTDLGAPVSQVLVGSGGLVYALSMDNRALYALDAQSGAIRHRVVNLPAGSAQMLLRNGGMFVLGGFHPSYVIVRVPVPSQSYEPASSWPVELHDNQRTSNRDARLDL